MNIHYYTIYCLYFLYNSCPIQSKFTCLFGLRCLGIWDAETLGIKCTHATLVYEHLIYEPCICFGKEGRHPLYRVSVTTFDVKEKAGAPQLASVKETQPTPRRS